MHAKRSWLFEKYLRQQSPERRRELITAEKKFCKNWGGKLSAVEQAFWESMQGYADSNEGAAVCKIEAPEEHNGNWHWKPLRDKALGYDMPSLGIVSQFKTFAGVPPSAAELYRGMLHQPG